MHVEIHVFMKYINPLKILILFVVLTSLKG